MKKALVALLALALVASLAACGTKTATGSSSASGSTSSAAASSSSASGSTGSSSASGSTGSSSASSSTPASVAGDVDPGVAYDDTLQANVYGTDGEHNMLSENDKQYVTGFVQDFYLKDDVVVAVINDITVTDKAAADDAILSELCQNFSGAIDGGTVITDGNHIYVVYMNLSEYEGMTKDSLIASIGTWGFEVVSR